MVRVSYMLLLGCLLCGPVPARGGSPARVACEYGNAWAELGNWQRAVEHYRRALARDPGHVAARLRLARGLIRLGDRRQAGQVLDRLPEPNALDADAAAAAGWLLLDLDRPAAACRRFDRALGQNARHALALFGKGRCHQVLFERKRAEEHEREALTAYRDYLASHPGGPHADRARQALAALRHGPGENSLAQAKEAFAAGDFGRAEKLLGEVIARQPGLPEAHYLLGMTLATPEIGRTRQAELELAKAGNLPEALLQRGILAFEEDRLDRAAHFLQAAIDREPGLAPAHYHLGLVHRDRLEDDKALACFRKVVELAPASALARRAGSKVQLLTGEIDRLDEGEVLDTASEIALGRKLAERIEKRFGLVRDPDLERRLRAILKRVAESSDRLPGTMPYRVKLLDLDAVNALSFPGGTIYLYRGLVDFVRARLGDADDAYAAVIGHEVVHVAMRHGIDALRLMESARDTGQVRSFDVRSVNDLMTGLGRAQEFEADQLGALYAYRAGFDPGAAYRFHRALAASDREIPEGLGHPTHDARAARLREYLLGLRRKARHFDAGLAALERGDFHDAVLAFEIFMGTFPASRSARNNLALARQRQALSRSNATAPYKLSTDVDPRARVKPISLRHKGQAQIDRRDRLLLQEAAEDFRSLLRLHPGYAPARINLAACLAALGEHAQARRQLRQVLEAHPGSAEAATDLAVLGLLAGARDGGEQARAAIQSLQEVCKTNPGFADAHFNLGVALSRAERPAAAREHLRAYLRFDQKSGWAELARRHLEELGE